MMKLVLTPVTTKLVVTDITIKNLATGTLEYLGIGQWDLGTSGQKKLGQMERHTNRQTDRHTEVHITYRNGAQLKKEQVRVLKTW